MILTICYLWFFGMFCLCAKYATDIEKMQDDFDGMCREFNILNIMIKERVI